MKSGGEGLLIRWTSGGTHAEVHRAEDTAVAPEMHRLRPGESYYGIQYELWAKWAGRTADVLYLQAITERARRPSRAVPIAARLTGDGWQTEAEMDVSEIPASTSGYGFTTGTRLVACSREQLIAQCVEAPETPHVWTPEAAVLVRPETVPFLVEALRLERHRSAERRVLIAAIVLAVALSLAAGAGARSGWAVMSALAAAWLALTALEYRRARSSGEEAFAAAREELRHWAWVGSRRSVHTELILGILGVVFIAESFGLTEAVGAAGLVKSAVREGEVWRLLTGTLLHGGVLHLAMNGIALWSLGPLVEAHSRRAFLSLLFVLSAICGSLLSLVLLPEGTSVGASGGILGMAGYLLVLGYRSRHALPRGFTERLGGGILATAVLGLVGYAWVDNATHLGGFVAGMLLAIAFGGTSTEDAEDRGRAIDRAGFAALGILVAGAVACLTAIYLALTGTAAG